MGWLLSAQSGDLEDEEIEPPVPAGLAQLSASLESLVEFLRVDTDLLQVAAEASAPLEDRVPKPAEVRAWLAKLPAVEKDDLLGRLIAGNDGALANELLQRLTREQDGGQGASPTPITRRTVAELLRQAEHAAEERQRIKAEKTAKEKARREREAAIARTSHLDKIAGHESALWNKVGSLIATKQPKRYDEAVGLLVDLRDLAARKDEADFRMRLEALRTEHARKPTLIDRLHKAGL
ncbi:MAG: hypothetical protein ACRED0_06520 [Gammaproteobacteria bacterium]